MPTAGCSLLQRVTIRAASRAGRIIGILLLLQMLGSAVVTFGLEAPSFDPPGFLVNAAHHAPLVGAAAVLGLGVEALWIAIAITLLPFVHERARALTLWLVVLAGVCLAVAGFENAGVMSMLSLSESHGNPTAADRHPLEMVRVIVASARHWAHFLARML